MVSNGGHILDYEGVDRIMAPLPPMIFIPTTAGTSADVSQFCIINNTREQVKIAIISKIVIPDIALIDPEPTTTMDPYLTACTGMDALAHAVEAFVSTASSKITDVHALEAIRLLKTNLPHGECNSLLLEHVVNFNYAAAPERFAVIAQNLGLDTRGLNQKEIRAALFGQIRSLRYQLGISKTLGQVQVKKQDISDLSEKALNDACLLTNPRKSNKRDIEAIYEEAL